MRRNNALVTSKLGATLNEIPHSRRPETCHEALYAFSSDNLSACGDKVLMGERCADLDTRLEHVHGCTSLDDPLYERPLL